MGNWGDVFVSVYAPTDLTAVKQVTDNGRTVYYLYALSAEGEQGINGEGHGSITLSANEINAYPLIEKGDHIRAYQHSQLASSDLFICEFICLEIEPSFDADGNDTFVFSGPAVTWELSTRVVSSDVIDDGAGGPATDSTTQILSDAPYRSGYVYPSRWRALQSYVKDGGDYLTITKQSVFDALAQLAEEAGVNFRYKMGRTIDFITNTEVDSGIDIELVTGSNYNTLQTNVNYAPVIACKRHTDHAEFYTRAYIEGGKVGDAALGISDMDFTGITIPTGFTVYASSNLIVNTAAETSSGLQIEKYLEFSEIRPSDDGSTSKQSAQEQLLAAGFVDMQAAADKTHNYNVTTVLNTDNVDVGEKVHLKFSRTVASESTFSVDSDLYVHRISHRADAQQERLSTLELSTDPIPVTPADGFAAMLEVITGIKTSVDNTTSPVASGGGETPTDHGALSGLEDDDHQQYLLASGTRELAGNLPVASGKTIDGVDLDVHAANPAAHHPVVTAGTSNPSGALYVDTANQIVSVNLTEGDGIYFDGVAIAMRTPKDLSATTINEADATGHTHAVLAEYDGFLNPSSLAKFSSTGALALQRLAIGQSSTSANDLRIGGGGTIEFDAGLAHIRANAADQDVRLSATRNLDFRPGGGANDQGSINIFCEDIDFRSSGIINTAADVNLTLQPNADLELLPADDILLDAGGQINVDNDIYFMGGHTIYTTSGDLELAPVGVVNLNPVGQQVEIFNDSLLSHNGWTSGWKGQHWGITAEGHIDARSIYVDELYARYFNIDYTLVKAGSLIITPSGGKLTRDVTLPDINFGVAIYVADKEGVEGEMIFAEGDYCEIRVWQIGTGALIASVFGQVYDYEDQGGGEQKWTFVVRDLGLGSAGLVVKANNEVIDYGQDGDSFINMTVNDKAGSPYIEFARWHTTPADPANWIKPLRIGDLGGITGKSGSMGVFVGEADGPHIILGEADIPENGIHGMAFKLYTDGANTGQMFLAAVRLYVDYGDGIEEMEPNGDVQFRDENIETSSGSTYYTLIDDDPVSPDTNDWIANEDGMSASIVLELAGMTALYSSTQEILIKAYVEIPFDLYGNCRLLAQIFDGTTYEALTTVVDLANQDNYSGLSTRAMRPLTEMSEALWDNAVLQLWWHFTPKSVATPSIVLDPRAPYLSVGDPAHETFDQVLGDVGFWTGRDIADDKFKLRLGGWPGSNQPAIVWDSDDLQIVGADDEVKIRLEGNSGDSYFAGVMEIDTDGKIFTGDTSLDKDGLLLNSYLGEYSDPVGYSDGESSSIDFKSYGLVTGKLYSNYSVGGHGMRLFTYGDPTTSPLNLSTVISTQGKNFSSAEYQQNATNNQPGSSQHDFYLDGAVVALIDHDGLYAGPALRVSSDDMGGVEESAITFEERSGHPTTSPASGYFYLYFYNGGLHFKKSDGSRWKVTATAV